MATRRDLHDTRLDIRVRKREMASWKRAALRSDEPLSAWIRKILNLAAAPAPPAVPPTVSGDQVELPFQNEKRSR